MQIARPPAALSVPFITLSFPFILQSNHITIQFKYTNYHETTSIL